MKDGYATQNTETWITLSAATERALERTEQEKEQTDRDPKPGRDGEKERSKDRENIERRLLELREQERLLIERRKRLKRG